MFELLWQKSHEVHGKYLDPSFRFAQKSFLLKCIMMIFRCVFFFRWIFLLFFFFKWSYFIHAQNWWSYWRVDCCSPQSSSVWKAQATVENENDENVGGTFQRVTCPTVFPIEMIILRSSPRAEKVWYGPLGDERNEILPCLSLGIQPDARFPLSAESREVNSDDTRLAPALIIAQYYRITSLH